MDRLMKQHTSIAGRLRSGRVIASVFVATFAMTAQAQLVNGDFEDLTGTFPNGWTTGGVVSVTTGIAAGSTNAAYLEPGGSVEQDFIETSGFVGFQFDYVLKLDPNDPNGDVSLNNRLRLRGAGNGNLVTIRLQPNGLQKFTGGFGWFTMIPDESFPSGSVKNGVTYYIRVVVGEFDGDAPTEYQAFLSEDGLNYVAGPVVNSFHQQGISSVDRPLEIVRFEAGSDDAMILDSCVVTEQTISSTSWDGEGASNNWSDAANWLGDTAPDFLAGSELLGFSDASLRSMPNNDVVGASIAGMAFNGPGAFTITGDEFTVNNAIQNNASVTQTFDPSNMVISAGTTIKAVGGDIDILSPVNFSGAGITLLFAESPGGVQTTMRLAGQVSGDTDLDKRQTGILRIENTNNDFTGNLVTNNGPVVITSSGALGSTAGHMEVSNNGLGQLWIDGAFDLAEPLNFNRRSTLAPHLENINGNTSLTGVLTVEGGDGDNIVFESLVDTLTLNFSAIQFQDGLTGRNRFRVTGAGTVDVQSAIVDPNDGFSDFMVDSSATSSYILSNAANTFSGRVVVQAGTLMLSAANNNNCPNASRFEFQGTTGTLDVTGLNGGTLMLSDGQDLQGVGLVNGAVVCDPNTVISPGDSSNGSGPGILEINGGLTLADGQTLNLEIGLPEADLLRVSGGTLTGATSAGGITIELGNAGGATPGTYTLIDWSGAGASGVDLTDFVLAPSLISEGAVLAINGPTLEVTIPAGSVVATILVSAGDMITEDRDFADEQTDFDGIYRYDVSSNGLFFNETLFIDGTSCCGGGSFQLADPAGMAKDADGNLYVVERVLSASAILQFSPAGSLNAVVVEEGNQFLDGTPVGVAIDSSNPANEILYFTAGGLIDAIYKVELDNGFAISTLVPTDFDFDPNDPNIVLRSLNEPEGIAVLPSGNIVVADSGSTVFREFDPAGVFVGNFSATNPHGVNYDADYGRLLLTKNFSGGELQNVFADTLVSASSEFQKGGLGDMFDAANIAGEVYATRQDQNIVQNVFGATVVSLPGVSHILVESSVHGLDFDNDGTLIGVGGEAEDAPDFMGCVAGHNNTVPPAGCSYSTFQRADISDDRDVDMNDVRLYQLIVGAQ